MDETVSIYAYDNYIFDCDGVILDSNRIKERNIEIIATKYIIGKELQAFIEYFNSNPGIPREIKINKFIRSITITENILKDYKSLNIKSLTKARVIPGFLQFINKLYVLGKNIFVISGGDEKELHEVFQYKNLDRYFFKILGGPRQKVENIKTIPIEGQTIYFGDSKIDYDTSRYFCFDFVFVYGFTSFKFTDNNCHKEDFIKIKDFNDLLKLTK